LARILIVEDEALIGELLAMYIEQLGHEVLGPASTVGQALTILENDRPAFSILDCSLGQQESTPVAEALAREGIPFAFATGRGPEALPEDFKRQPMIMKPYVFEDVQRVLASVSP
jgi:DNA-binding response OmpR family regulator